MDPAPPTLSPPEIARALGVRADDVRRWARLGLVEARRLPSGRWRIPAGELDRLARGKAALRERRLAWSRFEDWLRQQPVHEEPLEKTLAWVEEVNRLARAGGPLPEVSPEETARRVARMHRMLAAVPR